MGICIIMLIIFFSIIGLGLYKYNWQGAFMNNMVEIFSYPAATVNYHIVKYSDWQKRYNQLIINKNFYLTQQDIDLSSLSLPDDATLEKQALDELIKTQILNGLAKKSNVNVSAADIDQAYNDMIGSKYNDDDSKIAETLQKIYGLSIAEFKTQVIKDYLLRQKLTEKYLADNNNELDKIAKNIGDSIILQLKDNADFSDLAREYSDDEFALKGGDLGYISTESLWDFYKTEIEVLTNDEISDLIKTPDNFDLHGYYILKVNDERETDGQKQKNIQQIFIGSSIDKLLDKHLTDRAVKYWVSL
ncbi:MAG: peptidylprolyl isomerase [Patescibacteria group bacterium]